MRTRRRHSLAFAGTALLHAGALLWGTFGLTVAIEMPEIDFELAEVELVDLDAIRGLAGGEPEPPPPEPEPPPPPEPEKNPQDEIDAEKKRLEELERLEAEKKAAEAKKKREEARKKKQEQRKNFGKKRVNADRLGPPTSTFHLLLVPKKIRKLPFAGTAFELLEPWPDFDFLVRKGGLDPLRDFDHIVIASPNISSAVDTFLAVDYKTSRKKLVKAIERAVAKDGEVIEWVDDRGFLRGNPRPKDPDKEDRDTRWFVFHPKKKVAMFLREDFLEQILADEEGPVGEEGSARAFVDNLTKLRKFAAEQPLAGMQLKVADLSNAVSGLGLPFDTPESIELTVEAARNPLLSLRLSFADVVQSKRFANYFNKDLKRDVEGLVVGAVDGAAAQMAAAAGWRITGGVILDRFTLTRDEETAVLKAALDQSQIEYVLQQVVDTTKGVGKKADAKRRRKSN